MVGVFAENEGAVCEFGPGLVAIKWGRHRKAPIVQEEPLVSAVEKGPKPEVCLRWHPYHLPCLSSWLLLNLEAKDQKQSQIWGIGSLCPDSALLFFINMFFCSSVKPLQYQERMGVN